MDNSEKKTWILIQIITIRVLCEVYGQLANCWRGARGEGEIIIELVMEKKN